MSGWMSPTQDPEAWKHLRVVAFGLTLVIPGLVTISDNDRLIPYDEKKASGQRGATNERQGEPLRKFKSSHFLTDAPWPPGAAVIPLGRTHVTDHDQWNGAELLLKASYGGEKPVALAVSHPDLQRQDIDAATVTRISGYTDNGNGSGVITVSWTQHRPPEPTGGTTGGTTDTPEEKTATDHEIDAELRERERLDKEYENL